MSDTRNDLPLGTRTRVVKLLSECLADAIDLGTQVKFAHWKVPGPNFIALQVPVVPGSPPARQALNGARARPAWA